MARLHRHRRGRWRGLRGLHMRRTVRRVSPGSSEAIPITSDAEADRLREEGNVLFSKKCFSEALDMYRLSSDIAKVPNSKAAALRNIAQCHWQEGNTRKSLRAVLQSLSHDPKSSKAHFRAAECFSKMKDWNFACFHYQKSQCIDAQLFSIAGGDQRLSFAEDKRDSYATDHRHCFMDLCTQLDLDGDGKLNRTEIARFWGCLNGGITAEDLEDEVITFEDFRSRLLGVVRRIHMKHARPHKAPDVYKRTYRKFNATRAFYIFCQEVFDTFWHRTQHISHMDKVQTLSQCLPRGVCEQIVHESETKVLATIMACYREGARCSPLELLSAGEEEDWYHGVMKDLPASICLGFAHGSVVVSVKHLNKDFTQVETILCFIQDALFIYGACSYGWADLIQKVCGVFGVKQISGVQCTRDFLEAQRAKEVAQTISTESIASSLSKIRSANVLAIPRWSELPEEERWRETPMMLEWALSNVGA